MQDYALGFKILVYVHRSNLLCNITLLYSLMIMENRITLVTYWMIPFSDSQLREWLTGTKVTNCLRNPLSQRVPKGIAFHDTFPPHNLYLMICYGLTYCRERELSSLPLITYA